MTNTKPTNCVFESLRENALYNAESFVKMQMERNQLCEWKGAQDRLTLSLSTFQQKNIIDYAVTKIDLAQAIAPDMN